MLFLNDLTYAEFVFRSARAATDRDPTGGERALLVAIDDGSGRLIDIGHAGFDEAERAGLLNHLAEVASDETDAGSVEPLVLEISSGAHVLAVRLTLPVTSRAWLVTRCGCSAGCATAQNAGHRARLDGIRALVERYSSGAHKQHAGFVDASINNLASIAPRSVLLTPDAKVLAMSPECTALAMQSKLLATLPSGQLRLGHAETTRAFKSALADLIEAAPETSPHYLRFDEPSSDRAWIAILRRYSLPRYTPIHTEGAPNQHVTVGWLELRDIADLRIPDEESLRQAFNFTKREAEVARSLMSGLAPAAQAEAEGVTVDAINFHMKNIREKMGCKKQSQIVQMIYAFLG